MASSSITRVEHVGQSARGMDADAQSIDSDVHEMYAQDDNPNQIVTMAPKEAFRLGYFDVMCLVVNFMIGTGVFESQSLVMKGTGSTGASLLLWFAGVIYCLSGTHVYIEYGLNVPRYTINGVEQSVPRSGGDLNYLQYVYPRPAYRKNTVTLSMCIFGVGFIAFGNMAGNAINFGVRLLRAAGVDEPDNGVVRAIAIVVATLTCFIHAFSRRFGIWLSNAFAILKAGILLLMVVTAIVVAARGLPKTENVISQNTDTKTAFQTERNDANGYAHGFLAIIFSYWGFDQPNYIMGEISRPRRKHPIAVIVGVSLVCCLYMAVMVSYMVVVPKDDQINGSGGVGQLFFEMTLGRLGKEGVGKRIFNGILATSSVGNMIVMTYIAARVKQEVAKEGLLPYAKFFASNKDLSLGRLLQWMRRRGWFAKVLQMQWLRPEHHSEKTPFGAFVLHFFSCLILIFATWGMEPEAAYSFLSTLTVYVVNCFFGFFVGLGILILRFKGPPPTVSTDVHDNQPIAPKTWSQMTGDKINPCVSVICATIFTICNAWPLVTIWVAPAQRLQQSQQWWLLPTVAWAAIILGIAWFLGFLTVAKNINRRKQKVFVVEKKPEFESAGGEKDSGGGLVLVHETTYLSWVGKETLEQGAYEAAFGDGGGQHVMDKPYGYAGTSTVGGQFRGTTHEEHPQVPDNYYQHYGSQYHPPQGPIQQSTSNSSPFYQEPHYYSSQHEPDQPSFPRPSYQQPPPHRGYTGSNYRY